MAEEDIMWGKKRHLFGGIEPSNLLGIQIERSAGSSYIYLRLTLPKDTVVDGQVLCTVQGFVVRRKTGSYPVDEFDGVLVEDRDLIVGQSTLVSDRVDDSNETYYYAVFPYSTQGVYNRNSANRAVSYPVAEGDYIFGYDLDTNDPDPDTRVIYPDDVDNYPYRALRLGPDGTGCTKEYLNMLAPEYGSNIGDATGWFAIRAGEKFMPRPCMLSYDCDWSGGNSYYLAVSDYKRKYGTTEASDITNVEYNGNAMMQWPKIYTYREEVDGIYKFRCSNKPHGVGWDCWCNYIDTHGETDHFYTSIFHATMDANNIPRSISSSNLYTLTAPNCTLGAAIDLVTGKSGSYWTRGYGGWDVECLADRLLIQDLLVMMAGTTNTSSVYGYGRSKEYSETAAGGVNNNEGGLFYTDTITSTSTIGHRLFGMENLWGNVGRLCVGWIIDNGVQKIKITRGRKDGSTAYDFNDTGSGYIVLDDADISPYGTDSPNGYISEMKTTAFGRIPLVKHNASAGAGSSATYETDYFWAAKSGLYTGYLGGCVSNSSSYMSTYYGAYYAVTTTTSSKNQKVSFGLSCKPVEEA